MVPFPSLSVNLEGAQLGHLAQCLSGSGSQAVSQGCSQPKA